MGGHIQRNIVKEIMRECFPKKLKPNENFIIFFVQLLLLDPNWGITENIMNSRSNVQKLVKFVISKLQAEDTMIKTLKMQFYFICNLEHITSVPRYNRNAIVERLAPLKAEILSDYEVFKTRGYDNLRRNIASYATLLSGLGNPMIVEILDEALAALRSIMNEVEAVEFIKASKHAKEDQLDHLSRIICGIRLFNKDSDKGGAGIENLPNLLSKAIEVVKTEVESTLKSVMDKVDLFTTVIDKCYVLKKYLGNYTVVCEIPIDVEPTFMDTLKGLLLMHRQIELYIRNIINLIEKMDEYSTDIYEKLDTQLKKTHETVHMRLSVPVDIVFPLFEDLSDLWYNIQDQVVLLSKYNDIISNLQVYADSVRFHVDFLGSILDNIRNNSPSEIEQSEGTEEGQLMISQNEEVEVFNLSSFPNPDHIKLQYLGFCCWKLVETDGGLIPGNTSMGIAKYQNKYFIFSSPQAFMGFCQKPEKYINSVSNLGRRKPEFIKFLDLMDQLQQVVGTLMLVEKKETVKVMEDKEVQFESDCVQLPHIEPKYCWNIWDLKRDALVLANVSNCKTKSTQTLKNHSTQSTRTQTYLQKNKEIQTKKSNYTNVPKPASFIFGLRGRRDNKQFSIDITESIEK